MVYNKKYSFYYKCQRSIQIDLIFTKIVILFYMFRKQKDGSYKVVNKVKNWYKRYVRYGGVCVVKRKNLDYFISNKIYYSINSLGIDRVRQF